MSGRTFVLGDIHGACRALEQCLSRCNFDPAHDQLIALGDVCDGWPEVKQCIDVLLDIPNLIYILGNHDSWALKWFREHQQPELWLGQGGQATVDSYRQGVPADHRKFLEQARLYYLSDERALFVHAGINPDLPLDQQDDSIFLWDRSLFNLANRLKLYHRERSLGNYKEIYIGHSPTIRVGSSVPLQSGNVWMMDTGAAWDGYLTIMDIDSKVYYQSDRVADLYPGIKGR